MKTTLFSLLILIISFPGFTACSKEENKQPENNMKESQVMSDSITVAVIKTNMGTIEVQLFPDKAPKAVENFIGLANKGYYKGVIFHRVIDKFMIQGGDPTGTGRGGQSLWGTDFIDEFDPSLRFDEPGVLAMANAGPNTNGSQFFITVVPTPWLNDHHTIFGKVIEGMDVVYDISKVQTSKPGDKPLKDIVIEEVKIKKRANSEK